MKQYFIYIGITFVLLCIAVAATLYVWATIQQQYSDVPERPEIPESQPSGSEKIPEDPIATTSEASQVSSVTPNQVGSSPVSSEVISDIPLRDLTINEEQATLLGQFGIDVDTFVITSEMLSCAEEKLGVDRVAEITSGSSPAIGESLQLYGCING